MNISYHELLKKAKKINAAGDNWHHHYLPPNCHLNNTVKHLLILESDSAHWQ